MYRNLTIAFFLLILLSCKEEKRAAVYVDIDSTEEETTMYASSGDEVVVPFRSESGVKYVDVKVNGVGLEMIFDTGCSETLISVSEARYLYEKGHLTESDFLGTTQSMIADGSVVENMVINLREVVLDDKLLCPNVTATVSSNINAPLLLGNGVLDRLATVTIDNENESLIFKLK